MILHEFSCLVGFMCVCARGGVLLGFVLNKYRGIFIYAF